MTELEKKYFEMLIRTLHPVYLKDFSGVLNSETPFHIVKCALMARQLAKTKGKVDNLKNNAFPHLANASGTGRFENDYFGFSKPTLTLNQRRLELLKWINSKVGMSKPDVLALSIAITGKTPVVILNVNKGGWTLGKSALGVNTILAGEDNTINRYTYLVKFNEIIPSTLLKTLDAELTKIEKGGSKHIISALKVKWILGKSALGVDTFLRN